jgi:glycosyltransferase involved in cell wall biosynthesis
MGSKTMRVLFLSDHLGYPDGVTTGATTYFLNVLPSVLAGGVDVHVCFLRDRHPVAEKLEAQGIHPIFLNRSKWDPLALSDLLRLIRKHDVGIVHAAGMKGILLGRAAGRICRRKVIMHLHDTSVPGYFFRSLHRAMADWTDRCLAISNAVGELARREFGVRPERVTVLYNGIDLLMTANASPGARAKIRAEFDLPDDAPVVGIIGRLSPEKGQAFFLPAMPELLATHPDVRMLIVGEGPDRQVCDQVIAEHKMASAVRFTGHRSDIPDILAAIDVLLIPSLMEGLSFCAIEAMAAGRPVAAFRVGGLPELITHDQTGVLAPEKDASALVQQVRRLLDDRELSDTIVSHARRFVQRFSVEHHVRELTGIYEQVLHSPSSHR